MLLESNGLTHEIPNPHAFNYVCADVFDFTSNTSREKRHPSILIKHGSIDYNKLIFDPASSVILSLELGR